MSNQQGGNAGSGIPYYYANSAVQMPLSQNALIDVFVQYQQATRKEISHLNNKIFGLMLTSTSATILSVIAILTAKGIL